MSVGQKELEKFCSHEEKKTKLSAFRCGPLFSPWALVSPFENMTKNSLTVKLFEVLLMRMSRG